MDGCFFFFLLLLLLSLTCLSSARPPLLVITVLAARRVAVDNDSDITATLVKASATALKLLCLLASLHFFFSLSLRRRLTCEMA